MYQIFEITVKAHEIDLDKNLDKMKRLNWYLNGVTLAKDDNGLQYILDLSDFTLKCVMGDLFPLSEGRWLPKDFPSREELVTSAISKLRELPFSLEICEIRRIIKHE